MAASSAREAARILLIEDDPDIAHLYQLRLEREGYRVYVVGDGIRGLGEIAETTPDLVLLDIRLPGLDGIEILRRLRSTPRTRAIAVVVITNYDDPELRQLARELGAMEYVLKSRTTPSAVAAAVTRWLESLAITG